MDRIKMELADWLPDPFTVATRIVKSLIIRFVTFQSFEEAQGYRLFWQSFAREFISTISMV